MSKHRPEGKSAPVEPVFTESPWAQYAHCTQPGDFPSFSKADGSAPDAVVSRRELLTSTAWISGLLFAATAGLAALGRSQPHGGEAKVILPVSDLPDEGQAYHFYYPRAQDEAVLIHLRRRGFVAFSRRCTHLGCTVIYQPDSRRLFCPCHRGVFDPYTGVPVAGPPERRLARIAIEIGPRVVRATGVVP